MSGGYTRLTVQGAHRKAEVVVPDDEAVAALLPSILELLAEERVAGARPVTLVDVLGRQVDATRSLADQEVVQGTLLRVVRVDQAPPPPEVADVTDVVAGARDARPDSWRPVWGRAVTAVVAAAAGWTATLAATTYLGTDLAVLVGLAAATVLVATAVARVGATGPATVLGAAAVGAGVGLAPTMAERAVDRAPGSIALVMWAALCLVVALLAGVGLRRTATAVGALTGVGLAVVALALVPFSGPAGAAAVTAVLGTLVLGLLPGVAMTVSGLNGLDDRVVAGHRPVRAAVEGAVDETYRALTWATVATSGVVAVTGWVLAVDDGPWSSWLALVVVALVVLRARVLPLVPQRLALWAAGGAIALGWVTARAAESPGTVVAGAVGLVVVAAVAAGARPTPPLAARLRRAASLVELVAVLATVPLLLAHLGVFDDLLATFG
ncbi:EsaB/YukD family protein [Cellulomonas sp. URHB0016]